MSQPPEREGGTGEAPSATRDSIGRSSPLDGSPSRFPTGNRWTPRWETGTRAPREAPSAPDSLCCGESGARFLME